MKASSAPNWAWKPPKGIASMIERNNKKCDPMREIKAKKAEAKKRAP